LDFLRQENIPTTVPIVIWGREKSYSGFEELGEQKLLALHNPPSMRSLREAIVQGPVRRLSPSEQPGKPPAQDDRPLGERLPLSILVAEDNPINLQLIMFLLKKLGYTADHAGNGKEALECLMRQSYDIVLMDVQMPEMDGLSATREIVRRFPEADRPIIIAMTANAMAEDRAACLEAGMNDYASKPLKPGIVKELLEKWGTHLKNRRLQDQPPPALQKPANRA